jgi:serine/threonine protein kinase
MSTNIRKQNESITQLNDSSTVEVLTQVVGKYHIMKEIGRGGMSVVSLGLDQDTNKLRAIKVVDKAGRDEYKTGVVINSAISEASILKALENEYLPKIYDIIETGKYIYVVMEYIEGESLKEVLSRGEVLSESNVIKWGMQLCEVLDYLHSQNPPIIYRDMKPSNVMLQPDGNIKLIDFGIAREYKEENTSDTTSLGTRGYAAPEQYYDDSQSDVRTDIYNLGATMYHLVTGHYPSKFPYAIQTIQNRSFGLSIGLEMIIAKCTNPDPNERYQNVKNLFADLSALETRDNTEVLECDDVLTDVLIQNSDDDSSDFTLDDLLETTVSPSTSFQWNSKKKIALFVAALVVIAAVLFMMVNIFSDDIPDDVNVNTETLEPNLTTVSAVSDSYDSVNVNWTETTLMDGTIVSYQLLSSSTADGKYEEIYKGQELSFIHKGLEQKSTHYYKVVVSVSIDGKISTSESSVVSIMTQTKPKKVGTPTPTPTPTPAPYDEESEDEYEGEDEYEDEDSEEPDDELEWPEPESDTL